MQRDYSADLPDMTVGDLVEALFPSGTPNWIVFADRKRGEIKRPWVALAAGGKGDPWAKMPGDPIDVFAAAACLLARSGAYHHIQATTVTPDVDGVRRVLVTDLDRTSWTDTAAAWADSVVSLKDPRGIASVTLRPPPAVVREWKKVRAAWSRSLFEPLGPSEAAPVWWKAALALMAIADEACRNVGFAAELPAPNGQSQVLMVAVEFRMRNALIEQADGEGSGAYTISAAAPDIACVLPKSRTPALGCTLRSLSHNLALLPPRGLARARWNAPLGSAREPTHAPAPLNLILIPYPYEIPARAFRADGLSPPGTVGAWGWFKVAPLPEACPADDRHPYDELTQFVCALIKDAERDLSDVHGIVFPELALSRPCFDHLVEELIRAFPSLELIISGLHSDEHGRPGNFAAAIIAPPRSSLPGPMEKQAAMVRDIRQKHHRWKLDHGQIASYALGASLDPSRTWWEKLDVLSRSLTIGVLRGETTVTTLICEDLARVDPAQELLRAIGPNIVIALLMDSAQLIARWPGRYATVLAEDPGSSVLTLTSLRLIERVNRTGYHPKSRCVALWRDDRELRELHLPHGSDALCITLTPIQTRQATLDGRTGDANSQAWRLTGVVPLAAGIAAPVWRS
ncbi:hypothetical protein STVA_14270 [Allostella vacuolata]|nr:hypothetical protein STVA_14270 [Stella vacuolata]